MEGGEAREMPRPDGGTEEGGEPPPVRADLRGALPTQMGGEEEVIPSPCATTSTATSTTASEASATDSGGDGGWVNIGEQTWSALRHEWKYKSPHGGRKDDKPPLEKKRIDPDVIYTDVTSRGQVTFLSLQILYFSPF